MLTYTFDESEMRQAHDEWGCNCGPSALAFALRKSLDDVQPVMMRVGFHDKRYTSPSMMKKALEYLDVSFQQQKVSSDAMFDTEPMFQAALQGHILSLVRIQWTGPWTKPDANPKWAYRQTHWIATWYDLGRNMVFDCNGGILSFEQWQENIVPLITDTISRADGGWFPTHIWSLQ